MAKDGYHLENKMSLTRVVSLEDLEFEVGFIYIPGHPAKTTGPWIDSYPAEDPEIVLEHVYLSLSPTCHDVDLIGLIRIDLLDKVSTMLLDTMESEDE
jgi:hypothetical protein